ncbi:MAG: NFACT RNA binding domain-containing protein [bacterium]|nr:NFACT RNA binding domain-containing protein [bacterium]
MNHFLMHLLSDTATSRTERRRISSVRYLSPLLSILLETPRGEAASCLVVVVSTPGPFWYITSQDPLDGLGLDVFKRITGMRIQTLAAVPRERVVRLELDTTDEGNSLVFTLFGSASRVRVQSDDTIIESLDPSETGVPLAERRVPLKQDLTGLTVETLACLTPDEAPGAVSGLTRDLVSHFTSGNRIDAAGLMSFRDQLIAGKAAFYLASAKRPGAVAPLPAGAPAEDTAASFGPFETIEAACKAVGDSLADAAREVILHRKRAPLERRLRAREALREKLQKQLEDAEAFDIGRNEANILSAFQSQIQPGATEVELPNLYAQGETVNIELDPSLSIREQIDRRFKRASKLERSRDQLANRIGHVEKERAALATCLAESSGLEHFRGSFEVLERFQKQHLPHRQVRTRRPDVEKTYRRFDLSPRWFALVGRNDKENDEITFRVASPGDIWLHAQQTPGSHVVLKSSDTTGNPPAAVLEAAAGIAAHFSKAKHSTLVPVIYTLRKYVRKFRGSRPGQVHCEREKTLFVRPELPVQQPDRQNPGAPY